jgi:hypothetical protein
MSSPADMTWTVYQEPAHSFLANNTNRTWTVAAGDYDLTGYSSISGFNSARYTAMMQLYLPWPSGLADGYYGTPFSSELAQTGAATSFYNWSLNIESGSLEIVAAYNGVDPVLTLPGAYTLYTNRWLTVVSCGAETDAVYANWQPVADFGDNRVRLAVYDTATGNRLGKTDRQVSGDRANIAAYGTTVSTVQADADSVFISGFGGNFQEFRHAGIWCSFGTMFDPESETDRTWLTTRPGAQIGNATAWLQSTATTTLDADPDYYQDQSTDLLVPDTAGQHVKLTTGGNTAFTTGFSSTIIPKNQG